ncbi:hypothetical protein LTR16_005119 [Cryomyces antarcticus]|uniref:PLD phosphodiesterase domain-containing protein n=1 Tax=Cryomyces antarcticus TaxID=329879 RepID=A0ABR0LWS0_9PEZI|nr:hypothetical protein LTR60_004829 [Cryomyces antarcticus]KAK5015180.1 hypothetical protein LTR39_002755 [Cryomyces antarcticus]KAK5253504.1 hypothetical protein LTR16_005119 [Cryomyces antarcticus]
MPFEYYPRKGLSEKLFHTASLNGHIYPSSTWVTKFGLPPAEELRGLDLVVKSIFVRPFSVMHPKFVIVDGKTVWLPSCNVSWEDWFEGCLELTGPVVGQFVRFWEQFWYRDDLRIMSAATALNGNIMGDQGPNVANTFQHSERLRETKSDGASARVLPRTLDVYLKDIRAIFLPSPHHVNPRFRPLPWQDAPPSPPTPLNTFLLRLITTATSDVYIQTPNLTAPPVLSVLLAALRRGVTVHIVTSERLMILEQLVTAGTTTSRCVRKLVKVHKRLLAGTRGVPSDVEHGYVQKPGALRIYYYQPCLTTPKPRVEPVQSHLKLTIVDGNITVLGSGNMDRASWYTSQELGVAFFSRELAEKIRSTVAQAMESRTKLCYSSAAR